MAISLDNFTPVNTTLVNIKGTIRKTYRTNHVLYYGCYLPAVDFVERFVLVLYWNRMSPNDSLVEIRSIRRRFSYGRTEAIDPKLLRFVMNGDKEFCDAIVDIAHGRSFIKGLAGDYVQRLNTYKERAANTFISSVLFDHAFEIAMGLTFPWKVKGLFNARIVSELIGKVDKFIQESQNEGKFSAEIRTSKAKVENLKNSIDKIDSDMRSSHDIFDHARNTLRRFGIEYDMRDDMVYPFKGT